MNTSNSDEIVGFYSHMFCLRGLDCWYTSDKFTIEGIDDCNFEIGACTSKRKSHILTIAVTKDNKKSVFAKITVSFPQKEISKIVDNWTEVCPFAGEVFGYLDNIKINCEIIWYGKTANSSSIQFPLNLSSDFEDFHSNSSFSDLKISINGEELPAHKFILAAYSPVFLSMFETDMKEKRENRIVVEGVELNVMRIVLSILYTGCDKDLDEVEMAKKVLIVAERYGMTNLKILCQWKLFQKLEVSNVLDILDDADTYNAEALRAACMNFIVRNKTQMSESEDLEIICHQKPKVVCELLKKLMITR